MSDVQRSPAGILAVSRIIWAVSAGSMLMVGAVMVFMTLRTALPPPEVSTGVESPMLLAAALMTAVALPMSLFVRAQVFKRGWVGDVVTPQAYFTGNMIAWAICEGAAFFGFAAMATSCEIMPGLIAPAVALTFLLLLFPNGKAMMPTANPYAVQPPRL